MDNNINGIDSRYTNIAILGSQTCSDKYQIIENCYKIINNMRKNLRSELTLCGFSKQEISYFVNSQYTKNQQLQVLAELQKDARISRKAERIAKIIVNNYEMIEREEMSIKIFQRQTQVKQHDMQRMHEIAARQK